MKTEVWNSSGGRGIERGGVSLRGRSSEHSKPFHPLHVVNSICEYWKVIIMVSLVIQFLVRVLDFYDAPLVQVR